MIFKQFDNVLLPCALQLLFQLEPEILVLCIRLLNYKLFTLFTFIYCHRENEKSQNQCYITFVQEKRCIYSDKFTWRVTWGNQSLRPSPIQTLLFHESMKRKWHAKSELHSNGEVTDSNEVIASCWKRVWHQSEAGLAELKSSWR